MGRNVITWLCLSSLQAWLVAAQSVPSQAYTPVAGSCPNGFTLVRMAGSPGNQSLSPSEAAYVRGRRSQVIPQAWKTYLTNVKATNVSLPSYVSDILGGSSSQIPNFGIATSGGGYRAAMFGAGVLNALDGRNASSVSVGTGGLLQAATYAAGLSGGSWLLGSLTQANFPTIHELVFGYTDASAANNAWGGWNVNFDLFKPSDNPITDTEYLGNLIKEIKGKYDAGYPVTFADYWGRGLSKHFINGTNSSNFFDESFAHGAGTLWSSIGETETFQSFAVPFPIVIADLYAANENKSNILSGHFIPISNPIIEFTVYEMGSYDPMLSAFTPTKYLGTTNSSVCITNYDQLSFIIGTSSELFNTLNVTATFGREISAINSLLPEQGIELDVATWPNPFFGVAPGTFLSSNQTDLKLVDGFEDEENIPLQPLLVKARGLDTILAIDATGNEKHFSNGSSLIAAQDRANLLSSAYSFPPVPQFPGEFLGQNLTKRPTFFGCNTTSANESTPLLIYIANGGPPHNGEAPVTNIPTLKTSLDLSQAQAMLDQTFIIATQGYPHNASMTTDPEWPACLACAVVDRARQRAGETRSGVCESCFARYCWDGSTLTSGGKETVRGPRLWWLMSLAIAVGVWASV